MTSPAWLDRAKEALPELADRFKPDAEFRIANVYELCFQLTQLWRNSARDGNVEFAKRIEAYCNWAYASDDRDVSNAMAVAFLEHIPSNPAALALAEKLMRPKLFAIAIDLSAAMYQSDAIHIRKLIESVRRFNAKQGSKIPEPKLI